AVRAISSVRVIVDCVTPLPPSRGARRRPARAPLLEIGQRGRQDDPARPAADRGGCVDGLQLAPADPRADLVLADPEALGNVAARVAPGYGRRGLRHWTPPRRYPAPGAKPCGTAARRSRSARGGPSPPRGGRRGAACRPGPVA